MTEVVYVITGCRNARYTQRDGLFMMMCECGSRSRSVQSQHVSPWLAQHQNGMSRWWVNIS